MGRPRRRLLVEPRLQLELVGWALAALTLSSLVFAGIIGFILRDVSILAESVGVVADNPFFARLEELKISALIAGVATFIGLGAGVVYGGLVRSRGIAGPIVSLGRHIDAAADGSPSLVRFRADDHFADLSARFNRLVETLKGDLE